MKKIFKNKFVALSIVLSSMMLVYACKDSFLEVQPSGVLAASQLTSKAGLDGLLIGAYSAMKGTPNDWYSSIFNWVQGGVLGGDANKGSNNGDQSVLQPVERFEINATNGVPAVKWKAMYEGISRCNQVLQYVAKADANVSAADKARISGEARFLRGLYYFELKKTYNNTPYVDETLDYGLGIEKVANDADLWPKIEADFNYAATNLPETQGSVGRANSWAAKSFLAKTLLYQKKFADAKTLFTSIIASGKTANGTKYALITNFTDNFNAATSNTAESVFANQTAANSGSAFNANYDFVLDFPYNTGSNGPAGCCGFNQPSFDLVNSHRTDAKGLPLLDGSYNSSTNAVKSDQGIASKDPFTPDAGNLDPRLDWSVGRRGIPYLDWQDHPGQDWIRDQAFSGPYAPKKFVFYKSQDKTLTDGSSWTDGYSAINYPVIRFADVLLMAAEAEVETGSLETARGYVNQVRKRAANSATWVTKNGKPAANYVIGTYDTPFASQDAARSAVRFERRLELSGEGHRFFDLVRWGVAAAAINTYLKFEGGILTNQLGGTTFTAGKNEYMPIPQGQIDLQPGVLKQNPGY